MTSNYEDRRIRGRKEMRAPEIPDIRAPLNITRNTLKEKSLGWDIAKDNEDVSQPELFANEILNALPGNDLLHILPRLKPVMLMAGEDLYKFEGGVHVVYFPESAVISQLHVLSNGYTAEAAMIGREGLAGLSGIFKTPQPICWTRVLIGGKAFKVGADTLRQEFKRGAAIQQLLLAYTNARMTQLSQRAVCNGCHTIEQRVCSWLMMVSDRAGEEQLRLTHERIASHLGARRAGITEVAGALKERGIINYSRGLISIMDRQALTAAACECYTLFGQHTAKVREIKRFYYEDETTEPGRLRQRRDCHSQPEPC